MNSGSLTSASAISIESATYCSSLSIGSLDMFCKIRLCKRAHAIIIRHCVFIGKYEADLRIAHHPFNLPKALSMIFLAQA
jgi:hypothetical protein